METVPRRTNDLDLRTVARTMGAARVAIGASLVVLPGLASSWLGSEAAKAPTTKAALRALGVRDALLGLGTINALEQEEPVGPWVLAGAISDGVDAAATVLAWRHLPKGRRVLALALIGGVTAAGAVLAGQVDEG